MRSDTGTTAASTPPPGRRRGGIGRRGLAAAGGLMAMAVGTVAPGAVAGGAPAEPAPEPDADRNADGVRAATNGTYEPCTEDFGFGKVVEIVIEVDGKVPTPPLTFPTDVQVVVEYDPGSGKVTCIPQVLTEALWDDKTVWGEVLQLPVPTGNYVILPAAESCTQTQHTLRLVGAPAGLTVTVGQAVLTPPPVIFCPGGEEYVLGAAAPLMSTEALAALTNFVDNEGNAEGCNSDGSGTPSAALQAALTALVNSFTPEFDQLWDEAGGTTDCDRGEIAFFVFGFQVMYEAEVGRDAVFKLTSPPPPPAPEPAVVVPRFTG